VLTDPSVSAQHARITRHTNGYAIYDLNSKNGVMVNGKRVTQHLLRDGDRIRIGAQDMLFKQTVPSNTRKG
jgi:pSer/pThr/pTyr-binding forkhead associated (FHA) protein